MLQHQVHGLLKSPPTVTHLISAHGVPADPQVRADPSEKIAGPSAP
jgi:hypothetical protein